MFLSEKTISAPCDFNSKFVCHFVKGILAIKSAPYIATLDENINAKSILSLLGADIKKGDDICVQVLDNHSQEQAEKDLKLVLDLISGDISWQV